VGVAGGRRRLCQASAAGVPSGEGCSGGSTGYSECSLAWVL
jgi:hypothetical protein